MYFQCVLILALSLIQNEAAQKFAFPQGSGPGRIFRSGSPKRIQGSFDTAADLAKLIQTVRRELVDERDRLQVQPIKDTSPEEETHLQALLNVIQKKIDEDEGIRIHVLKNPDVLDKYKKDLGSRAVFIDNPEVLAKYVKELKKPKKADTHQHADFENLMLKRRNAVFRLEEPEEFVKPINIKDSQRLRKRYEGGKAEEISKRFNKVTNKNNEMEREMSSGKKPRDPMDQSREVRKPVQENRPKKEREISSFKNEREERGYNNMRDKRGDKREFKDYSDYKKQGNPNQGQSRTTKPDYDYDKPRRPKKSAPRDYDNGFDSKKGKDKFDDYGRGKKKDDGWGQPMGSESRKKPFPKMDWNEKPKRNFENNERRRPKSDDGWAPSIRGGDHFERSSKNNEGYGFGNTPIPFNRPRNIYVDDRGE